MEELYHGRRDRTHAYAYQLLFRCLIEKRFETVSGDFFHVVAQQLEPQQKGTATGKNFNHRKKYVHLLLPL